MLDYEQLRDASAQAEDDTQAHEAPKKKRTRRPRREARAPKPPSGLAVLAPKKRLILALILYADIVILGFLCLFAFERIGF